MGFAKFGIDCVMKNLAISTPSVAVIAAAVIVGMLLIKGGKWFKTLSKTDFLCLINVHLDISFPIKIIIFSFRTKQPQKQIIEPVHSSSINCSIYIN